MQKDVVSALRFAGSLTASDALDALDRRQDIEQLLLLMHAGALRFKSRISESSSTDFDSLKLDNVIVAHLRERGYETITGLHIAGPAVLHGLCLRNLRKAIQQLAAKGIFIGASDHFANEGPWRTSHVTLEEAVTRCESAEVLAALLDSMTDQNTRFLPPKERRPASVELDGSIDELPFRQRTCNALRRAGIVSVRGLLHARAADLMVIQNFGFTSLQDVVRVLEVCGLWFEKEPGNNIHQTKAAVDGPSRLDLALRHIRTTEGIRLDHLASSLNLSVPELRSLLSAHYGLKPNNKAGLRSNIRAEFLQFQRQKDDRTGIDLRKPDEIDDSTDLATRLARLHDDQNAPSGREVGGNTLVELLLAALQEHPSASAREIGKRFGLSGISVEQLLCRHFDVLEEGLPVALAAHRLVLEKSLDGVDLNAQILAFIKEEGCISIRAVSDATEVEDVQAITYLVSRLLGFSSTRRNRVRFIEKRMRDMHQVFRKEQRQLQKKSAKDARIAEMVELRIEGHTLDEIASKFGITRERVRQLVKRELGAEKAGREAITRHRSVKRQDDIRSYFAEENEPFPIPKSVAALIERQATLVDDHPDANETITLVQTNLRNFLLAHLGIRTKELHATSGLKPSVFKKFVPSEFSRFTISGAKTIERKWADDEILNALQKASTYHFPLTGPKYDALIAVGEIDGPSSIRILQIFGTWKIACDIAGVESADAVRDDYERKWSEQDLRDVVAEYLLQESSKGTFSDFESWLKDQSGYPSGQTVRNYLGEWLKLKHDVLISDRFKERINE